MSSKEGAYDRKCSIRIQGKRKFSENKKLVSARKLMSPPFGLILNLLQIHRPRLQEHVVIHGSEVLSILEELSPHRLYLLRCRAPLVLRDAELLFDEVQVVGSDLLFLLLRGHLLLDGSLLVEDPLS